MLLLALLSIPDVGQIDAFVEPWRRLYAQSPLLSTLILIASGYAAYSHAVLIACLLITAGAVLAAWDLLFGRKRPTVAPGLAD